MKAIGTLSLALALCALPAPAWPQEPRSPVDADEPASKVWIRPVPPLPGGEGAPLENPYAGNKAAIKEGERLYGWYNCGGCHAARGGGGMGPALSDDKWIYGSDAVSIFNSIWQGRPNGMPTWAGKIPEDQIWKLVAYLQALPEQPLPWIPTKRKPSDGT